MTPHRVIDPRSTANATLDVREHTDLLVIGAGPAGLAAAIAGVRQGLAVVLVDENPVPPEVMGDDVPLHFGQRMSGAVRNRTAMTEALLASEPLLGEAFEAGVDVRLGTIAWGLYANGASVSWLPGLVAGISDGESSGMIGCKAAIVAAGRRDMGLAFPGWELPGVMGATAAERLARSYGALAARRAVVLGTSAEALLAALAMHRAGVSIAAVVEQATGPIGPASLLAELAGAGVQILTRHIIASATGGPDGVTAATLLQLDTEGRRMPGSATTIDCDTIVLGVGTIPVIELLDAIGARAAFVPERGGHVPVTDGWHMTTVPGVYAVGDCAGVWAEKSIDRSVAEAEGKRAADHAVRLLSGTPDPVAPAAAPPMVPAASLSDYRLAWIRSAVIDAVPSQGGAEPHVCQCEEVTAREILEVRPPRYLQWRGTLRNSADLSDLLGNGAPNPDQVKRLTRAGMGLCQGRRCREQVAGLLALGAGTPLAEVPLATHRAPVRPMPLGLAGSLPESPEMAEHWDIWFGIPGQVTSYWDIEPAAPAEGGKA
jgi:thioredoxin reductase